MTDADLLATYDRVAVEYGRRLCAELDGKPLDRALLAAFAESVRGRGEVLDVGCGPGHVTAHLGGLGVDAAGLDLSPAMIDVARATYPGGRYQVGDMTSLGDRGLAGLVALYAICHLPPERLPQVASSFAAALAPGGLALLGFHVGSERTHLDEWWGYQVSIDFWFHSIDAVATALENAGLSIEARVERRPYVAVEHPSQRGYLLARRT